ncbi:hypothetical protein [Arsenicibacter rosenii]|uniref:Uncharacterized protein n=1 Tax=Arsenicibacter rosenii TaxID=1750698 RepID=A0A1S2VAX7_9BACT|nr:hypothetical protein [Arsenicibacter rosenii]OIN55871.1 hypothetical protein BLX24_27845 [Arsenicibacter rosenii]
MDQDKLIELGLLSPEIANMVKELKRLEELTVNDNVKSWLKLMADGWLTIVDNEVDPRMTPYANGGEGATIHSSDIEGVGSLATIEIFGAPTSVWYTNSFMHRMHFLRTGMLAIAHLGSVSPIGVRLDVEEIGISVTNG